MKEQVEAQITLQILWEYSSGRNGRTNKKAFLVTMVNGESQIIRITNKMAKWYAERGVSEGS